MTIFDDESEKRRRQAQLTGGNTGLNTSGIVGGSTSNGQIMQPNAAAPSSSGFANLDRYLELNQGVGAGLASATNKGLESDVNKFGTDSQNMATTTSDSINKNSAANQSAVTGIKQGLETDASANADKAKTFLGSGYNGPSVTDNIASLGTSKSGLNDRLGKVDDNSTIKSNLANTFNYNSGFGALDSFLMQGDKSGRDELARIKGRTGDVNKAYDTSTGAINAADTAARSAFDTSKTGIKDYAKTVKGNMETEATKRAEGIGQDKRGNIGYANASIGDAFDQNQIDDLSILAEIAGLDPVNYAKTYKEGKAPPPPPPPVVEEKDIPNIVQVAQEPVNKITPTAESTQQAIVDAGVAPRPNNNYDNALTREISKLSMGGAKTTAVDLGRQLSQPIKAPSKNRFKIKF